LISSLYFIICYIIYSSGTLKQMWYRIAIAIFLWFQGINPLEWPLPGWKGPIGWDEITTSAPPGQRVKMLKYIVLIFLFYPVALALLSTQYFFLLAISKDRMIKGILFEWFFTLTIPIMPIAISYIRQRIVMLGSCLGEKLVTFYFQAKKECFPIIGGTNNLDSFLKE